MSTPTVQKQVLENGPRNYVAQFTCPLTTGDTLANYLALDPTSGGDMGVSIAGNTLYPGTHLKLMELRYDISDAIGIELIWDASSPQNADIINGLGGGHKSYSRSGGLFVPQSAGAPITGATGKVLFTLIGAPAAGQFFSITVAAKKDIAQ